MNEIDIGAHDQFFHVRVIVGIVTGLAVARLLSALARAVRPTDRYGRDWLQLSWAAFLFLYVVHFWWFEYGLSRTASWQFGAYAFVIGYSALLYFASAVLLPEGAGKSNPDESYVIEIRQWFFALMILMIIFDIVDSGMKGRNYFGGLGLEYQIRQMAMIIAAFVAIFVRSVRYHGVFVAAAILSQVFLIFRLYARLT